MAGQAGAGGDGSQRQHASRHPHRQVGIQLNTPQPLHSNRWSGVATFLIRQVQELRSTFSHIKSINIDFSLVWLVFYSVCGLVSLYVDRIGQKNKK